ncbi:MAG: tripartite tricarboxylate transporter TctB family protein [Pseudomonadota bacterium]
MRIAELLAAGALMALSVYFMVHATVLPIGWTEFSGPGGGAFPFWLSAIMLVCTTFVFGREVVRIRVGAPRLPRPFLSRASRGRVLTAAASVVVTVALMGLVGTYVAIPLFLVFYLRVLGGHAWPFIATMAVATPVILFFFFEVTLRILLPKGVTEPLFLPLYAIFF